MVDVGNDVLDQTGRSGRRSRQPVVDVGNDVLTGSDQTGRSDHRSRQQWLTLATMCWIRLVEVTAGQDSSG